MGFHPIRTMLEPLRLNNPKASSLPRTFIYCTRPAMGLFGVFAHRARTENWKYHELATGHTSMITAPRELAYILLKAAD